MTQTLRVRPDPLVVKRHNDLFDLWTAFTLEHADDPDYDPDDDPDFVTQARHVMGLAPSGNGDEITKRRRDIDMDPDFKRFRHWWISLAETLLFEHSGTLPSGRQLHTIARQDGRTYLRIGGDDLTIHLEDTADLADAIDDQLDLAPGERDDITILTTTGDLELGPRPEGGLLLRRVDTAPSVPSGERTVMAWALPDDDAATVSDMLAHLATLNRPEPTSLRQVNDHLGFTLLSDGRIAPILGRGGQPEPVTLDPDEAAALADVLGELRRRKLKVTTGTGARGIGALLGGRKKAEHAEVAQVAAGRLRVGWWSDGLVTVELANPDGGVVELQLAAKDVSDAMKILRELASRASGGGVRKGRRAELTKRIRDADHNPNYHRYSHGWIPLVRQVLTDAVTIDDINKAIAAEAKRITGRDVRVNMAGSDPQIAREHGEGLLRGLERFPHAPLGAIHTYGPDSARPEIALEHSEAFAVTREGSIADAVAFNVAHAAHPEEYRALLSRAASEREVVGSDPISVAIHEFGHVLSHHTGGHLDSRHIASSLVPPPLSLPAAIKREISGYARTNRAELTAEAFTDVMVNGDAASTLSRAIFDNLRSAYDRTFPALAERVAS